MQKESWLLELPAKLKEILKGFKWEENKIGWSKAKVFKLSNNGKTLYLKINKPTPDFNLEQEKVILEWLYQKLPVPEVIYFSKNDDREFLLLSEIQGKVSHRTESDNEKRRNIQILAESLKKIHSVPTSGCPINNTPDKLLQLAKERSDQGNIDTSQFDEKWSHKSVGELFEEIIKLKPEKYDLVFSHGDYCLPNILVKEGKLSGFVDWSYGGINDRYFDFAAVAWSIGYNYGEEWIKYFFEDYGLENVEWDRIRFYQMLNEFFQQ